ncbi:MAG TPA: gliding motility-associated C-terminal domain-containing protein, partial [Edaphocola sp.]|nr:gliding motility-associated C-terminal domain-containing protein [Edaphocola sp.]
TVIALTPQWDTTDVSGCHALSYGGRLFTRDTMFVDTLANYLGCDSLYRLTRVRVDTLQPSVIHTDTTVCNVFWFNNILVQKDTTFIDTLFSLLHCDSVYLFRHIRFGSIQLALEASPDTPYLLEPFSLTVTERHHRSFEVMKWMPAELFLNQNAGNKTQSLRLSQPTEIMVIARSTHQCWDTARIVILPQDIDKSIKLPNAFSPNGDGRNDVFLPKLAIDRAYRFRSFQVFNRWGELVFSTAHSQLGWDGYHKGQPAEQGVYFYRLQIEFADGSLQTISGEVTLIR